MRSRFALPGAFFAILIAAGFGAAGSIRATEGGTLLNGKAAMGDWKTDAPGVRRKITAQDLPPPSSNPLAINRARVIDRSVNVQPQVLPG